VTYRRRSAFWSFMGAFYAARAASRGPRALGAYSARRVARRAIYRWLR
jgi:hypothetical protein